MSTPDHLNQRIEAMAELHAGVERNITTHQRSIERLTSAIGQPRFLYATILVVVTWIAANLVLQSLGIEAPDPAPFHYMHLGLTLSAMLMATIVLVTQDRQMALADKRGQLDLQINLMSEAKVAKVIALLEELRRDLPDVRNRRDPEAQSMALRVDPLVVVAALEEAVHGAGE